MESDSSSHTTEVTVEAPAWRAAVTNPVHVVERAVAAALDTAGNAFPRPAEVSVLLADDDRVKELNRTWRGRDNPTNVLSFPAWDPGEAGPGEGAGMVLLGDVAVALETVLREAAAEGKPPDHHLAHLVVHGTLHLLGHDHEEEGEAEAMEALEAAALARLGVPDPYRDDAAAAAASREAAA